MTISVAISPSLLGHLSTFEVDGATVADVIFAGGRLAYPGRKELEHQLGQVEPYTLELEARVIRGLPAPLRGAIRMLSSAAPVLVGEALDPTLELLWAAHASWPDVREEPSPDRLVAALVAVQLLIDREGVTPPELYEAAEALISGMHSVGFPPSHAGLEELFDGAWPACVGLGLVEVP